QRQPQLALPESVEHGLFFPNSGQRAPSSSTPSPSSAVAFSANEHAPVVKPFVHDLSLQTVSKSRSIV
ncbi:hypothetical protein EJB05_51030, partial [Eragrostis curvula]